MADRETLAAYAREVGIWDGRHWHASAPPSTCVHCGSVLDGTIGQIFPCPGPDYTQDTDALWKMATQLHPHLVVINSGNKEVWVYPDSASCEEDRDGMSAVGLPGALCAVVLAGIEARR